MEKLREHWLDMLTWCVAAIGLALIYTVCVGYISGAKAQEHHAQGHNEYQGWASNKTSNCCNNDDCGDLADDEWRENNGRIEIHILGAWCPVLSEHYVIKGRSPNWERAHACVNKNANWSTADPCERLLCFMGTPKG